MKRSLLYIGILFSAVSCGRNDHALQSGDLLFQAGENSDMTGAITAATGENGRLNFSHVGIAVVKNGADSVLEATTNGGVRLTALPEFLARSAKIGGRPTVVAMRLKDTAGVSEAVRRARNYLGLPYDYSFRPDNGVTLEEACTAALKLLGYDVTTLSGSFPAAQLNKAGSLGLRAGLSAVQGQGRTLEDAAVLFYNALTASTAENQTYAATLGFTVTDGRIDLSSVLLSSVEGPFVADGTTQLPFAPAAVYRNDTVATDAALNAYDVYYYSASARTVWIYSRKAAGRITAVSPSASAPTSVTVAGTSYTLASSAAASVLSSLNGGGVGQVVTLLLGMNNEAVAVLTGEEADSVFYGVVQTSSRSLTEENGADVLQSVQVACTDGVTRTVNVDK